MTGPGQFESGDGPVAVVTGAAGGLGYETAAQFLAWGGCVVMTDINERRLQTRAAELPSERTLLVPADIRDYAAIEAVLTKCISKWNRVDVIVNTAGGSLGLYKPIWQLSTDEWDLVHDVNLTGAFHCIKAVSPFMIEQRSGLIVLVASGSGLRPSPETPPTPAYSAAKAGVVGLMKACAKDLGPYGVRVNAVCPGITPHSGWPPEETESRLAAYFPDTMLRAPSSPSLFASFVRQLCQMTAASGQIFNLDSKILF
jgi:NAD(P)-dependent dehydrogenase (short-subunit alcohol dehydrogenase family)